MAYAAHLHVAAAMKPTQRPMCFKTKQCSFFLQGKCNRGNECTFAHNNTELRNTPDLSKTKICHLWRNGRCTKFNCNYAHGEQELKPMMRTCTQVENFRLPSPCLDACTHRRRYIEDCQTDVSVDGSAAVMSPVSNKIQNCIPASQEVTRESARPITTHKSYDDCEKHNDVKICSHVSSPVLPSTASPESLQLSPHHTESHTHSDVPLESFNLDEETAHKSSASVSQVSDVTASTHNVFTDPNNGNIFACLYPLSEEAIRSTLFQTYVE